MEASMSIFAITQTQISHAVPNNTMPRMIRIIGIVARKQSDRELANGYTRPWALRRFDFLLSCNPLLWVCVAAAAALSSRLCSNLRHRITDAQILGHNVTFWGHSPHRTR